MRKQFDLQYYLEHPETKVVTRDGRKARIICTDLKNVNYPISAAFEEVSGLEFVEIFTSKGEFNGTLNGEHNKDLFFDLPDLVKKRVPLTYDDLLERVKAGKTMWITSDTNKHATKYAKFISAFNENNCTIINGINCQPGIIRLKLEEILIYNFADGDPCWKEVED